VYLHGDGCGALRKSKCVDGLVDILFLAPHGDDDGALAVPTQRVLPGSRKSQPYVWSTRSAEQNTEVDSYVAYFVSTRTLHIYVCMS